MAEKYLDENKPDVIHLIDRNKNWSYEKADSLVINDRVKESAREYKDIGLPERFAQCDSALPKDMKEYIDLNKNAIVMITALSHNKDELPLKRVYIDYMGKEVELEKLLSDSVEVKDEEVRAVFGDYREDSFYLLPIYFMMKDCKLVIDWGKNRKGFTLKEYPSDLDEGYIVADKDPSDQGFELVEEALREILEREY